MTIVNILLLLFFIIGVVGCNEKAGAYNKNHTDKESSVGTFVDGITGRSSVKAGQKAKKEIERISKQEHKELEEVMGK